MAGIDKGSSRVGAGVILESLDEETARRIEVYLERALAAEEATEKDFHVRHARQLLEGVKK